LRHSTATLCADGRGRKARTNLHTAERQRRAGLARVAPRKAGRPLLLSQGRHARLHEAGVTADENKAVVQAFYDEWNAGDIDFDRLVHPEITNHQPDRDPETGLELFRQAIQGVMQAVPDSTWTTIRLFAEGDFVVCHNRWSGTYGGTVFRGVPTRS